MTSHWRIASASAAREDKTMTTYTLRENGVDYDTCEASDLDEAEEYAREQGLESVRYEG